MQHPQTMALLITKETWPIAAACLPAGFTQRSMTDTIGGFLVINQLASRKFEETGVHPIKVIENIWCEPDRFEEKYSAICDINVRGGSIDPTNFFPVSRKDLV